MKCDLYAKYLPMIMVDNHKSADFTQKEINLLLARLYFSTSYGVWHAYSSVLKPNPVTRLYSDMIVAHRHNNKQRFEKSGTPRSVRGKAVLGYRLQEAYVSYSDPNNAPLVEDNLHIWLNGIWVALLKSHRCRRGKSCTRYSTTGVNYRAYTAS
jgi:hypothetical protein